MGEAPQRILLTHFLNVSVAAQGCIHANPEEAGKRCMVQAAMDGWETALCATCKGSKETGD